MSIVEIETSEAEVSVVGITAVPTTITLVHEGRDSSKVRRSFVQQVAVHDVDLVSRVLSELHTGDRIQATVVNEWYNDGCKTYLADFVKVRDAEPEAVIEKGAITIAQNDMMQIINPLKPDPRVNVLR